MIAFLPKLKKWLSDVREADKLARSLESYFSVGWANYRSTGFGKIKVRWENGSAALCSAGISSFPQVMVGQVMAPLFQEVRISGLIGSQLDNAALVIEHVGDGMIRTGRMLYEGLVVDGAGNIAGARYICTIREEVKLAGGSVLVFELAHYCE